MWQGKQVANWERSKEIEEEAGVCSKMVIEIDLRFKIFVLLCA